MKLSNLSVQTKLWGNFIFVIFFFVLFSVTALFGFERVKETFLEVKDDSVPDIVAILELKSVSKRLFAEIQGYIATGDEDEVEEFQETVALFDTWLDNWKIDEGDQKENTLKEAMVSHKVVFVEFGEKIFRAWEKQHELLDEYEELSAHLLDMVHGLLVHHTDVEMQREIRLLGRNVRTLHLGVYKNLHAHSGEEHEEDAEEGAGSAHRDDERDGDEGLQPSIDALTGTMEKLAESGINDSLSIRLKELVDYAERILGQSAILSELLEGVEDYEDDILRTLDEAVLLQSTEVKEAFAQSTATINRSVVFLSVACAIFFILAFVLSRMTARSITAPLSRLMAATKDIADGDLTRRTQLYGKDEIGKLGLYFNEMTDRLQETMVSREYLDSILSNMSESLIVLSPQGKITKSNRAAQTLLGYDEEELLGLEVGRLLQLEQRHGERDGTSQAQADLNGQIQQGLLKRVEAVYTTKENKPIPVLFAGAPLVDRKGDTQGSVCVAADISRLKEMQQDLENSFKELQKTQDQLVQSSKLASIGELAAGVAHELNQPLMIIRTGSQVLDRKRKKGTLDEKQLDKHLDSILSNSKRMMNIIDHLRTFSRQSSVVFSPVDMNKVVGDCFYMIGEQLKLKNIEVSEELAADLPTFDGDANQIEQVILNLLGNARDALEEKFASTASGDGQKKVSLTTRISPEDPNTIELLVSDNAGGIPLEKQERIFDPFFTTKEEGKGTGLGLSISYGIIQDHKGRLEIAETGEQGTTFRIQLPIS